jgi:hypothetical protein
MTRFKQDEIVIAVKSLDDKNGPFLLKGKQYRICTVAQTVNRPWYEPYYELIDTSLSRQYQHYRTPWIKESTLLSAVQRVQDQEGTTP